MTTNRKEMPAPFELARNFVSMNGTGRTCEAQQGWTVTCGNVGMWGGRYDSWSRTKSGAVEEAWRRYDDAHTEDPQTLLGRRIGYVKWLLKVWPAAPAATKAMELFEATCEHERQLREAAAQRQASMNCTASDLVSDDTFRTVINSLRRKGYEKAEIAQIITSALEGCP